MIRLDPLAPDAVAESMRFLDGDYIGKVLFKNLLLNHCGVIEEAVKIPMSRYGDPTGEMDSPQDATVLVEEGEVHVEIKFARINIADRTRGGTSYNWAFNNLLKTPNKQSRSYHIAVAIGLLTLGAEHPEYWDFETEVLPDFLPERVRSSVNANALPHAKGFLDRCGFFIFPFEQIPTNFFRRSFRRSSDITDPHFAWGYDAERCSALWASAMQISRQRIRVVDP